MLYLSKSLKSRDRPSLCTAPPPPLRSVKIREAMAWTSLWTGLSSLFFPKQRACSQARLGQTHDTRVNKSWQLIPIKICQCCYKSRISCSKDDQDYFFKILRFINRLNFLKRKYFFFHQMRFKICRCNHFFLKKKVSENAGLVRRILILITRILVLLLWFLKWLIFSED